MPHLTSPFALVRSRLDVTHESPLGLRARCPAHRSRSATLVVREGHDGVVLLTCHGAGHCTAADVMRALGLRLSDLFPGVDGWRRRQAELADRPHRQPSASEIEREVAAQLKRVLDREEAAIGCRPAVVDRHIAEARRRAGERYRIRLKPPAPIWYAVEPHASDPLWGMCVRRALEERAWACNVDVESVAARCAQNPTVADKVLRHAAALLREFA